jgi:SET domain-containing protein
MDNFDLQIKQLNTFVTTRIAPSPIHGVGVFALHAVQKGQQLFTDMAPILFTLPHDQFCKLRPEVSSLVLERWPNIVTGSHFLYPETRIQAFMNHSDNPNYDAVNDISLREISAGEEITEDYRKIPSWEIVFPWLVVQ